MPDDTTAAADTDTPAETTDTDWQTDATDMYTAIKTAVDNDLEMAQAGDYIAIIARDTEIAADVVWLLQFQGLDTTEDYEHARIYGNTIVRQPVPKLLSALSKEVTETSPPDCPSTN